MYEKWNEMCFTLSDNLSKNISEQIFETKVIQAFEKLGWSEFRKEIIVREHIQLGASNTIIPDLIIRENNKNLFVIEIKRPNLDTDNSIFQNQLSSYMGILRCQIGILIGNKIQIFYDDFKTNSLLLIDEIVFERDNKKGDNFIDLFSKKTFNPEMISELADEKVKKTLKEKEILNIKKEIKSEAFREEMKLIITSMLEKKYNLKSINEAVESLNINISDSTPEKNIIELKTQIEENSNKILKRDAIHIIQDYFDNNCISVKLDKNNIVFSNMNKANNDWWLEPKYNMFDNDFYIILNDSLKNKLYIFYIPRNTFQPPQDYFYNRIKEKRFSIGINGNDTELFKDMKNRKNVSFIDFLKYEVEY